MALNRVTLIGNLGGDPDLRYTPSGAAVCELRLATSEKWTGKDGQKNEKTEWHRVIVWGKTAEIAAKYLGKGQETCIEGRLQTRDYEAKDGTGKRYVTEVVCDRLVLLRNGERGGGRRDDAPEPPDAGPFGGGGFDTSDLPF